jgi:hypothetical protein
MVADSTTGKKLDIMMSVRNIVTVLLVFALAVILGNGFNLIGWSYIVQVRHYLLLGMLCIGLATLYFVQYRSQYITFKYYTAFITVWPFCIIISSLLQGGILIEDISQILSWTFVGSFFIIFYHFRFSERMILWILGLYALTTVGIQIAQQTDPLFAIFGGDPEDLREVVKAEERNGLVRFFVGCIPVQMVALYYSWCKMQKTFSIFWGILSALMLVSIYLYLTKQVLISTVLTLAVSFYMIKGRRVKIQACVLAVVCLLGLGLFWENLFGDLITDSKDDNFSHAIRFEFIEYIMDYNLTDPIGVLFGHGTSKSWFAELEHMLYYPSDVGFFGESIYFGWLWALAYFYVVYRIMVTYRHKVPLYIRLFIICSGIISIFIFPYRNRIETFNWICVIYICSLYIDDRKDLVLDKETEPEIS